MLRRSDPLKEVMLCRVLGEGAFAQVFSGVLRATGEQVALKVLSSSGGAFESEVTLLAGLCHPNVVAFKRAWLWGEKVYIALQLADASSLELVKHCPPTEAVIAEIASGVLSALAYLHRSHIVHRDVKAANVLLTRDGVLLSDLGVSGALSRERATRTTLVGSPLWLAPEVICNIPYSTPSDIWSFGIFLIELLDGAPPNSEGSVIKAVFRIADAKSAPPEPKRQGASSHLRAFIATALRRNPSERPTAEELFAHPFLTAAREEGGGALALEEALDEVLPLIESARSTAWAAGAPVAAAAPTAPPSEGAIAAEWSWEEALGGGGGEAGGCAEKGNGTGSLVMLPLATPPPPPLLLPLPRLPPLPRAGTLRRSSSTLLSTSALAATAAEGGAAAASSSGSRSARSTTNCRGAAVAEPLKRLPWASPTAAGGAAVAAAPALASAPPLQRQLASVGRAQPPVSPRAARAALDARFAADSAALKSEYERAVALLGGV